MQKNRQFKKIEKQKCRKEEKLKKIYIKNSRIVIFKKKVELQKGRKVD